MPKCMKCDHTGFRLVEFSPVGGNYKLNGVCCTMCGVMHGTVGYYDEGTLLQNQKKSLAALETTLAAVQSELRRLTAAMR